MSKVLNRVRMRARIGVAAAALAVPLTVGQVAVGHAASGTWTCEASIRWTTSNTLGSSTVPGTFTVLPGGLCVQTDLGAPFVFAGPGGAGFTFAYQYSGNCVEGTLAFQNGNAGVFVAGILIVLGQGGGTIGTTIAVGAPAVAPCTGVIGSSNTWSGPGIEAGVR